MWTKTLTRRLGASLTQHQRAVAAQGARLNSLAQRAISRAIAIQGARFAASKSGQSLRA